MPVYHDLFPMKKAVSILLASTILFVISCEEDLDVAPYEPITIVYGIINIKDTVQYVRINRGFSTTEDPYETLVVEDITITSLPKTEILSWTEVN